MDKAPTVSVIIPVYNRPWCIRRAAESVVAQDYRPIQLIIVDDGSTDDTGEFIAGFEAKNRDREGLEVLCLRQENRGVSAARNLGLRHARGEYVALLDSDDTWQPEKTSRQLRALIDEKLIINQTGEAWIRRGKRVNPPKRLLKKSGDIYAQSLDHCAISPSAVLFRKELIREVGDFDEAYPACEDYEMWLRVTARYPVGLVPDLLMTKYGGHEDQLSATIPTLDKYRIHAIVKTLESGILTEEKRRLTLAELQRKSEIYIQGCLKRDREQEAQRVRELVAPYSDPVSD
ncbi:MAG: glycosyltransferase family 2 protein [Candidatus Sumerlaeia bacterium]